MEQTQRKVVVTWETLDGKIHHQKFSNWVTAEEFASKKETQSLSVQWIDIMEEH